MPIAGGVEFNLWIQAVGEFCSEIDKNIDFENMPNK